MIPEKEREALMRLTMCAREECIMCKYQGDCNFDFQYELATKNMNILAEALRKTNNSEKPNNCEHITEDGVTCAKYPACDDCLDNPLNKVKGSEGLLKGKDEPTISKMEQVEDEFKQFDREDLILLIECQKERIAELLAKDEPTWEQVKEYCNKRCLDIVDSAMRKKWYTDEPQTDCPWK